MVTEAGGGEGFGVRSRVGLSQWLRGSRLRLEEGFLITDGRLRGRRAGPDRRGVGGGVEGGGWGLAGGERCSIHSIVFISTNTK
jgi:hypothetical protein